MKIDTERLKEAVLMVSEVEIDFSELIQNAEINDDGNIESQGGGVYVLLSPEYEILTMAGGVSPKASQAIMEESNECDK